MTIEAEQKNCKGKEMTIVNGRNRITEQFEKNKGILTPIYAHVVYRYGLVSDTPHCLNCLDDLKEMKNIVKVGYFAAVRNKDGGINISFSKCRVSDFFAFFDESYGRDVARYKALRNETFGIDQISNSKYEVSDDVIYDFDTGYGTIRDQYNKFINRVMRYYKDIDIKPIISINL